MSGPELKFHRKLIQSYVNTRIALRHVEEVEEVEARRLLLRLLDSPALYFKHFRTYVLLRHPKLYSDLTSHEQLYWIDHIEVIAWIYGGGRGP